MYFTMSRVWSNSPPWARYINQHQHKELKNRSARFVEEIEGERVCAVCMDLCVDPVFLCSHLHTTCLKCSLSIRGCPTCRSPLMVSEAIPILELLGDDLVRCDFHKSRWWDEHDPKNCTSECDWEGRLRDLPAHLDECPCQPVKCPNSGCGWATRVLPRSQMREHKCAFEPSECKLCHGFFNGAHECPLEVIKCGCGGSWTRRERHQCLEQVVACEICAAKVKRRGLKRHMRRSAMQHMALHMQRLADRLQSRSTEHKESCQRIRMTDGQQIIINNMLVICDQGTISMHLLDDSYVPIAPAHDF